MDAQLTKVRWHFALDYLNDIFKILRTPEEHIHHVLQVLTSLYDAGMTLNLNKCQVLTNRIDNFGHVIRHGRFEVSKRIIGAGGRLQYPTTMTELQSYIGLRNTFRQFGPNFARVAPSLNMKQLVVETQTFDGMNEDETTALDTLQAKLVKTPMLAFPRSPGACTVDTDGCHNQIRCALLEKQLDRTGRPIRYWYGMLYNAKHTYDTAHRECLAVVWAVILLWPYLEGIRFTVWPDHDALKVALRITDYTGKLLGWWIGLKELKCDVNQCAGIKHQAADIL